MDTSEVDRTETVAVAEGVELTQLVGGERMNGLRFRIEPGAGIPEHDHPHEQLGYLMQGELTFVLDGGREVVVGADESYLFAGDERHAAENRGDAIAVGFELFSPPRSPGFFEE